MPRDKGWKDTFLTHHVPVVIAVVCVIFALNSSFFYEFRYERTAIVSGEYWRMLTGHFVHTNLTHLVMNLAALGFIWILLHQFVRNTLWWVAVFSISFLSSLIFLISLPQLQWYVGFSGVIHGLIVFGAFFGVLAKNRESIWLIIFVVIKLLAEALGFNLFDSSGLIGSPVVTQAHLIGALLGLFIATLIRFITAWIR